MQAVKLSLFNSKFQFLRISQKNAACVVILSLLLMSAKAIGEDAVMFRSGLSRTGVMPEGQPLLGKVKWQQRVGNPSLPGVYGDLIMSSPALAEGIVYFGSQNGWFYALESQGGKTKWKFQTGNCVHSSPAVVHSMVFFGSHDKHLYALDADTGKEKWKFRTDGLVRSSPAVSMAEVYHEVWDGQVLFGSEDGFLYALQAASGKLQWRFKTQGPVFSSPAVMEETVYVGSLDGHLYAVEANTGKEKWRFKTGYWITSAPAVFEGDVYVGSWDGNLYCLAAATGQEKWRFDSGMVLGRQFSSSPAVSDGLVLAAPEGSGQPGGTQLFALERKTGKEKWRCDVKGAVEGSPVVYGKTVLLVDGNSSALALDLATGCKLWECRVSTGGGVVSSPTISDGKAFFGSNGGVMTALE